MISILFLLMRNVFNSSFLRAFFPERSSGKNYSVIYATIATQGASKHAFRRNLYVLILSVFVIVCNSPGKLNAQIITTVAGTGVGGVPVDGVMATNEGFLGVAGVVTDASGNLYISDDFNNQVFKVTTDGIIHIIVNTGGSEGYGGDGGPATAAIIAGPSQLAMDASGNLYFCELAGGRIVGYAGRHNKYRGRWPRK